MPDSYVPEGGFNASAAVEYPVETTGTSETVRDQKKVNQVTEKGLKKHLDLQKMLQKAYEKSKGAIREGSHEALSFGNSVVQSMSAMDMVKEAVGGWIEAGIAQMPKMIDNWRNSLSNLASNPTLEYLTSGAWVYMESEAEKKAKSSQEKATTILTSKDLKIPSSVDTPTELGAELVRVQEAIDTANSDTASGGMGRLKWGTEMAAIPVTDLQTYLDTIQAKINEFDILTIQTAFRIETPTWNTFDTWLKGYLTNSFRAFRSAVYSTDPEYQANAASILQDAADMAYQVISKHVASIKSRYTTGSEDAAKLQAELRSYGITVPVQILPALDQVRLRELVTQAVQAALDAAEDSTEPPTVQ